MGRDLYRCRYFHFRAISVEPQHVSLFVYYTNSHIHVYNTYHFEGDNFSVIYK